MMRNVESSTSTRSEALSTCSRSSSPGQSYDAFVNGVVSAPGSPATSHSPNTRWQARWPMVPTAAIAPGRLDHQPAPGQHRDHAREGARCSAATGGTRGGSWARSWTSRIPKASPCRYGRARPGPRPSAPGARARGRPASRRRTGRCGHASRRSARSPWRCAPRPAAQRPDDLEELGSLHREGGECGLEGPARDSRSSASRLAGSGACRRGVLAHGPQDAPAEDVMACAEVREQVIDRPTSGPGEACSRAGAMPSVSAAIRGTLVRRMSRISSTGRTGFAMSVSALGGGRYWIRTSDLADVNRAL